MPKENSVRVLSVDIGSSWIKSALFRAEGHALPGTLRRVAQPIRYLPDGGAEIDPEAMRRAFSDCVEATLQSASQAPVASVSISCFWHGLLGANRHGQPVTPVYSWADSRSSKEAWLLRRELSEREVHGRTGCMLHSSFWPAKLRWLQKTQPRLFESVARWMSPAEWLQASFCGRTACGFGMASGTGVFNPSTLQWDDLMLEVCGLTEDVLNPLSEEPLEVQGRDGLRFPALREALWHPAIGDGAAGNLGCGAGGGEAALNLGTSAAIRVVKADPPEVVPLGLFRYCVDRARPLIGGAVSNAGNLRQWCLTQLRLSHDATQLEAALAERREPAHGLLAFPFWVEERFPHWDDRVPAAVFGFRQSTSALDLVQALTEAVYHRLATMLETLERTAGSDLQLIVSGGAARSGDTLQRLCDVLARPATPSLEPEASLRGAAVYALERLGVDPSPPRLGEPALPDPRIAEMHRAQRRRLRELEDNLRHVFQKNQPPD